MCVFAKRGCDPRDSGSGGGGNPETKEGGGGGWGEGGGGWGVPRGAQGRWEGRATLVFYKLYNKEKKI